MTSSRLQRSSARTVAWIILGRGITAVAPVNAVDSAEFMLTERSAARACQTRSTIVELADFEHARSSFRFGCELAGDQHDCGESQRQPE